MRRLPEQYQRCRWRADLFAHCPLHCRLTTPPPRSRTTRARAVETGSGLPIPARCRINSLRMVSVVPEPRLKCRADRPRMACCRCCSSDRPDRRRARVGDYRVRGRWAQGFRPRAARLQGDARHRAGDHRGHRVGVRAPRREGAALQLRRHPREGRDVRLRVRRLDVRLARAARPRQGLRHPARREAPQAQQEAGRRVLGQAARGRQAGGRGETSERRAWRPSRLGTGGSSARSAPPSWHRLSPPPPAVLPSSARRSSARTPPPPPQRLHRCQRPQSSRCCSSCSSSSFSSQRGGQCGRLWPQRRPNRRSNWSARCRSGIGVAPPSPPPPAH